LWYLYQKLYSSIVEGNETMPPIITVVWSRNRPSGQSRDETGGIDQLENYNEYWITAFADVDAAIVVGTTSFCFAHRQQVASHVGLLR
jgi:hypothetical protein